MNTNWNDPNFQGFRGQNPFHREGHTPKPRKAVGTPFGRTVLNLAVTLVFAAVYFYIVLPPINLKAPEFYVFALLVCGVYGLCAVMTSGFQGDGVKGYFKFLKKQCLIPLALAILLVVTALIGSAVGWQATSPPRWRRSPLTRSPCWTRTPPPSWATASWASWRTWSPSLKFRTISPRSTIRAGLYGWPLWAMPTSSSGSPTAPRDYLPI